MIQAGFDHRAGCANRAAGGGDSGGAGVRANCAAGSGRGSAGAVIRIGVGIDAVVAVVSQRGGHAAGTAAVGGLRAVNLRRCCGTETEGQGDGRCDECELHEVFP